MNAKYRRVKVYFLVIFKSSSYIFWQFCFDGHYISIQSFADKKVWSCIYFYAHAHVLRLTSANLCAWWLNPNITAITLQTTGDEQILNMKSCRAIWSDFTFHLVTVHLTYLSLPIKFDLKIIQIILQSVEVRGRGVERSLLDPKVVGSNPGGAEIGLHDFHDPQKWARILVQ